MKTRRKKCTVEATSSFKCTYFESQSEGCQEMWVKFNDYNAHLGNATNNCLESHNQKLKDLMSRSSNLTEIFRVFLASHV